VAGIFGLLIGSFLNVVVYRLPKMLERQWTAEYAEFAGQSVQPDATFNLMLPKSHCQHCGHQIRWYENIPILSYLFLRAKCSSCQAPISARYPLVELSVGLLFTFCISKWGVTPTGFAWCGFSAALVALSLIDWDTTLLPDNITLPLLWAGLILSATKIIPVPLISSLWGAVAGYLSLWLIYWAFKLITGKEGMGYGDFKLFAALGAWFGWTALIPVILMASVVGALIGLVLQFTSQLREGGYVPFGPFLGAAGLCVMMVGSETLFKIIGIVNI
jgi:leader peptidase (prepilin peptidase)/N-methyltransferase